MINSALRFCRDCRTAATGADYYSINPRGTVPCLVLDDGTVLADTVAVLAYVGTLVTTDMKYLSYALHLISR